MEVSDAVVHGTLKNIAWEPSTYIYSQYLNKAKSKDCSTIAVFKAKKLPLYLKD